MSLKDESKIPKSLLSTAASRQVLLVWCFAAQAN